jgi:hypothetical protein
MNIYHRKLIIPRCLGPEIIAEANILFVCDNNLTLDMISSTTHA